MSGLGLFYYLTRLKLAVNHDAFDVSSLSHLGKLHILSIDWKNKTRGMGDFETIHRHMRQLQSLSLNVSKATWTNPMELKLATSQLASLSIESQDYIYTIEPLFLYAAYRYPMLKHLLLKTHLTTSLLSLEHEESGFALLDRYNACITFAQQCRKLDTLVLCNVRLDVILLEALETVGISLKKLGIDTRDGLSPSIFGQMIRIGKSSRMSFDLMASLRTRNTRLVYESLSYLHLTDLSLAHQANSVSFVILLGHCHHLERCTLRNSVICLNNETNDKGTHAGNNCLRELVLDKVTIESGSLFDYLSCHCKKLVKT